MPIVVGVLLAIAIAALAKFTRFDEERSFYSTVLVIIASYYVLFAVLERFQSRVGLGTGNRRRVFNSSDNWGSLSSHTSGDWDYCTWTL